MGHCRSCKYYEFSGENSKGYCSWFKAYYYADDSCKHYEEGSSSSSGGCFFTTACCKYKGLPDDCAELETLRRFRDTYLKETEYGSELIRTYYESAPALVERIEASKERDAIYDHIYEAVTKIILRIEHGENERAVIDYLSLAFWVARAVC